MQGAYQKHFELSSCLRRSILVKIFVYEKVNWLMNSLLRQGNGGKVWSVLVFSLFNMCQLGGSAYLRGDVISWWLVAIRDFTTSPRKSKESKWSVLAVDGIEYPSLCSWDLRKMASRRQMKSDWKKIKMIQIVVDVWLRRYRYLCFLCPRHPNNLKSIWTNGHEIQKELQLIAIFPSFDALMSLESAVRLDSLIRTAKTTLIS